MQTSKKIYSKTAIVLFSLLGSTVLGTILYAINLKVVERKKYIWPNILVALVYSIVGMELFKLLGIPSFYVYVPLHLVGSLMLVFPIWNWQIGNIENLEKRKAVVTLAIVLLVIASLIVLNISLG